MKIIQYAVAAGILFVLLSPLSWLGAITTIRADHAAFLRNESNSTLELYYQLVHIMDQKRDVSNWNVEVQLNLFKNDTLWISKKWDNAIPVDSAANQGTVLNYIGKISLQAAEGAYIIRLVSNDGTFKGETDSCRVPFIVQTYKKDKPMISDVVLASSIREAKAEDERNPFYKNGLVVFPNPDRKYLKAKADLFYYTELYNLISGRAYGDYLYKTEITRMDGSIVQDSKIQKYPKNILQDAMAVYEQLQTTGVDTGSYQLQIMLYDSSGIEVAHQSKVFAIVEPAAMKSSKADKTDFDAQFQKSSFAKLAGDALDEEFSSLKYILPNDQQIIAKHMGTDDAKRRFLFNYWLSQDENQSNAENAHYIQHKQRVASASLNFKEFNRKAWKTDRGRVFIIYGAPNNIERFPSSIDQLPYEVWSYDNIENGVEFVFADLSGNRSYTLLHSTKIGEVYNPDYSTLIKR
jgi:GWxTD domain-containing protein